MEHMEQSKKQKHFYRFIMTAGHGGFSEGMAEYVDMHGKQTEARLH